MLKKKTTIKKVSVDRFTHEFNEEGDESARKATKFQAMGEVRKFVHDLRDQQRRMQVNSRQKVPRSARKDDLSEIQVQGQATGSNFYPHNGIGIGGVPHSKFGTVQTVTSSPSKSNSLDKKRDSPRRFKMPAIKNIHQKAQITDMLYDGTDLNNMGSAPGQLPGTTSYFNMT